MIEITPEEYLKVHIASGCQPKHTLAELQAMAKRTRTCDVCGQPAWKLGNCGLCFTCTTGEADDSDDYELI